MDTSTVLEIIAMLDNKINVINEYLEEYSYEDNNYNYGMVSAYEELSIHLQSYIESQLNGAENSTGE